MFCRRQVQKSIRDHFPVRRSGRKSKSEIEVRNASITDPTLLLHYLIPWFPHINKSIRFQKEAFEQTAQRLRDKDESGLKVYTFVCVTLPWCLFIFLWRHSLVCKTVHCKIATFLCNLHISCMNVLASSLAKAYTKSTCQWSHLHRRKTHHLMQLLRSTDCKSHTATHVMCSSNIFT